jgi:hypothetical protein
MKWIMPSILATIMSVSTNAVASDDEKFSSAMVGPALSIGQLCKWSESVVVGSVLSVAETTNAEGFLNLDLKLLPSEKLWGDFPQTSTRVSTLIYSEQARKLCDTGLCSVFFLSRKKYDPERTGFKDYHWGWT